MEAKERAPHNPPTANNPLALLATLGEALALMLALQGGKLLLERWLNPLVPDESFARRMVTAGVMLLFSVLVYAYARLRRTPLSILPRRFGKGYLIFTCVAALLLASAPAHFTGGYQAILLTVYGSLITPLYEELLFRGYLWNRLDRVLSRPCYTYLWSVALFTLWHLGYMTSQLLGGNVSAVLWKLAAGLGYGVVLGAVRLKTKSCYAPMLVHGLLNLFMI